MLKLTLKIYASVLSQGIITRQRQEMRLLVTFIEAEPTPNDVMIRLKIS